MTEIPPLQIPPDEADRELLRAIIAEAEVAGRPERAFGIVREALYDAWREIDALRAAQEAQRPKEEEPCTR